MSPLDDRNHQKTSGRAADPAYARRMKKMLVRQSLAALALLSASLPAGALDVAKLTPPQAAYYHCMLERAALQGKRQDGVAGTLPGGGLPDEADIRRAADASLGAFDDAMWPDLIRVIEAR